MSRLSQFYAHRKAIEEQSQEMTLQNAQVWEQMEEQILREETMPQILQAIAPILQEVKIPLSISLNYAPDGVLVLNFTRNTQQIVMGSGATIPTTSPDVPAESAHVANVLSSDGTDMPDKEEGDEQPDATDDNEAGQPQRSRSKSVGFAVHFKDGTVVHERKAVDTWIQTLQKIGLENICNNRRKHHAWHRVNKQDICIVERTETIRESDGRSPQQLVDGFYVMTQLSNDQKEKDLLALGEYMPKLGIKVVWDDETTTVSAVDDTRKKPVVDEDAPLWNYPIKEQFRTYLSREKSVGTANSYTSTLDNAVREWVKREVDALADSVFSYTTAEDVRLCIDMLNASQEFMEENARKHNAMSASLNQYLNFIEEREKRNSKA